MGDGAEMCQHIEEITHYATIEAEAERFAREVLGHEPTPDELEELLEVARYADPGDMPSSVRRVVNAQITERIEQPCPAEREAIVAGRFWMVVLLPADGPGAYKRDRKGRPRLPGVSRPASVFLDLEDAQQAAAALTEKTGRVCVVLQGVPRG